MKLNPDVVLCLTTDKDKFKECISTPPILLPYKCLQSVQQNALTINNWIEKAVHTSTTMVPRKRIPPYWSKQLQHLQNRLAFLHRQLHRSRKNSQYHIYYRRMSRALSKQYINEIRKAKKAAWRNFVTLSTPWGKPYKVTMKYHPPLHIQLPLKSISGEIANTYEDAYRILLQDKYPSYTPPSQNTHLFPLTNQTIANYTYQPCSQPYPESLTPEGMTVEPEDIKEIVRSRNNKSSPGIDQIRYSHLKMVNIKYPTLIANLATACLQHQTFPNNFKTSLLTLLLKEGKEPSITSAYRPISLLPVLGKIIERTIADHINAHISVPPHTLSPNQYGFRRQMSTEMALNRVVNKLKSNLLTHQYTIAISYDIASAFDSPSHQSIINGCKRLRLPKHLINIIHAYLLNRKATYKELMRDTEKGCPQGSVLGPILWIIAYDPILAVLSTMGHVTCFADDTLVILSASSIEELQHKYEMMTSTFDNLLNSISVQPNTGKTEILLLTRATKPLIVPFVYNNHTILSKDCIKYLGIMLDFRLDFNAHFKYLHRKSLKITNALKQTMTNKAGYSNNSRRIMLQGIIEAIWKYSSTVFSHRLFKTHNRKLIRQTHRQMLILQTRSYRTASYLPLTIIGNWTPMEYQVHARSMIYARYNNINIDPHPIAAIPDTLTSKAECKSCIETETSLLWQKEWDKLTTKGQWTKTLLPKVGTYTFPTSYWITQMLTGHGAFGSYLHRFKRRSSPACQLCESQSDTPDHALYHCPKTEEFRPSTESLSPFTNEFRKFATQTMKKRAQVEFDLQRYKPTCT